jgi:hypothetical protein
VEDTKTESSIHRGVKMKFAVINEGKVENVIVADSVEIAQDLTGKVCIETTNENIAHIGFGCTDGVFEQPDRTLAQE